MYDKMVILSHNFDMIQLSTTQYIGYSGYFELTSGIIIVS